LSRRIAAETLPPALTIVRSFVFLHHFALKSTGRGTNPQLQTESDCASNRLSLPGNCVLTAFGHQFRPAPSRAPCSVVYYRPCKEIPRNFFPAARYFSRALCAARSRDVSQAGRIIGHLSRLRIGTKRLGLTLSLRAKRSNLDPVRVEYVRLLVTSLLPMTGIVVCPGWSAKCCM
jgi:hypothetical protein